MKQLFVSLLLIGVAVVVGFYVFLQLNEPVDNDPVSEEIPKPSPVETLASLLNQGRYAEVLLEVNSLLKEEGTSESNLDTYLEYAIRATVAKNKYEPAHEARGDYADLYSLLYTYASNPRYSNTFRASTYAEMNRVFENSYLSVEYFLAGLRQFDNGQMYNTISSDPALAGNNTAIAYTALYDLNEAAEELRPDKFTQSWQAWSVGLSIVESPALSDLEPAFFEYLQNQFAKIDLSTYTLNISEYQKIWIEQALLQVKSRLSKKYPNDFELTKEQIDQSFQNLLTRSQRIEDDEGGKNIEFIVRMSYASALLHNGGSTSEINTIVDPLAELDITDNIGGILDWMRAGDYTNPTGADYLLYDLYQISLTHPTLQQTLEALGWQY